MASRNPLTVEVTRGGMVESRHRGAAVVMDAKGNAVHAWGEIERIVYPRSAIKPLQALAVVETGAAEAFAVTDAELALASASHSGQPQHMDVVLAWLERIGLGADDLECGAHEPLDPETAKARVRAGESPGPADNNCSGKHAGFLTLCLHHGLPIDGYTEPAHRLQSGYVTPVVGEWCGVDLSGQTPVVDGCGIPVWALPLERLATGWARLGAGQEGSPEFRLLDGGDAEGQCFEIDFAFSRLGVVAIEAVCFEEGSVPFREFDFWYGYGSRCNSRLPRLGDTCRFLLN